MGKGSAGVGSVSGISIRVWLDDDLVDRPAPPGWVHVTTAWEAIELLGTGRVVEISLDNDLGDDQQFGQGKDVVHWLDEQQTAHGRILWPVEGVTLHTANPHARDQMKQTITRRASLVGEVCEELTPGGKPKLTFLFDQDPA